MLKRMQMLKLMIWKESFSYSGGRRSSVGYTPASCPSAKSKGRVRYPATSLNFVNSSQKTPKPQNPAKTNQSQIKLQYFNLQ